MWLDMVPVRGMEIIVLLAIAHTAFTAISNLSITDVDNRLNVKAINEKLDKNIGVMPETRRKSKLSKDRSTSSSSNAKESSAKGNSGLSLLLSSSAESSSEDKSKNNYEQKSTVERHGWRKWHRKCTPCPDDMRKKWRDPRIKWICGAYQRARRSFKSLCMMHYRNCQDGTMFVKIYDHRCQNDTTRGDHFFYDYKVFLSMDSSKSGSSSESSHFDSSDNN